MAIEFDFNSELNRAISGLSGLIEEVEHRIRDRARISETLKHDVTEDEQREINEIYETREPATKKRIREFLLSLKVTLDRAPTNCPAEVGPLFNRISSLEIFHHAWCRPAFFSWHRVRADLETIAIQLSEINELIPQNHERPERRGLLKTNNTVSPRKRGRPPIPEDRKARALHAKKGGASNAELASILYGVKHPTREQKKNAWNILKYYETNTLPNLHKRSNRAE